MPVICSRMLCGSWEGARIGGDGLGRLVVFFFSSRRRHTRCSRDWSSDVCSSDLQFRAEFFNAFNHPNFANPNASLNSPGSFGKVSNTLSPILGTGSGGPGDPREVQFALKLYF